eukprot:6857419-Prorocentrum_lima.AAC.1
MGRVGRVDGSGGILVPKDEKCARAQVSHAPLSPGSPAARHASYTSRRGGGRRGEMHANTWWGGKCWCWSGGVHV